jgi:hypothetical protein
LLGRVEGFEVREALGFFLAPELPRFAGFGALGAFDLEGFEVARALALDNATKRFVAAICAGERFAVGPFFFLLMGSV